MFRILIECIVEDLEDVEGGVSALMERVTEGDEICHVLHLKSELTGAEARVRVTEIDHPQTSSGWTDAERAKHQRILN